VTRAHAGRGYGDPWACFDWLCGLLAGVEQPLAWARCRSEARAGIRSGVSSEIKQTSITNFVKPLHKPMLHSRHEYTLCNYNASCNNTVTLHLLDTDYMAQGVKVHWAQYNKSLSTGPTISQAYAILPVEKEKTYRRVTSCFCDLFIKVALCLC